MPITIRTPIRPLSQAEFGDLAYSVMGCVFEIHRDLGRFFDEKIYKRELAHRHPGVQLEVPIEVTYDTFKKTQYLDVLVNGGGPFEFKTAEAIAPRHTAQLLNYMLLTELRHGKLVNLGRDSVEHEFINTSLTRKERTCFHIDERHWRNTIPGAKSFRQILISLLQDWGAGLDLCLYQEALTHFLGGEVQVLREVKVQMSEHNLGYQTWPLAAPHVAFALTALPEADLCYKDHAQRMVRHTDLNALLWANIDLKQVTFTAVA